MDQGHRPADVCTFIFPRREAAKRWSRASQTSTRTPNFKITTSSSNITSPASTQFPVISLQSSELPAGKYNHSQFSTSQSSIMMATSSSSDTFGAFKVSESTRTIMAEQNYGVSVAVEYRRSSATGIQPQFQIKDSGQEEDASSPTPTKQSNIASTGAGKAPQLDKGKAFIGTELLPAFEDEILAPRSNRSSWFTVSAYCRDDNEATPSHDSRINYSPSISSSEYLSEEMSLQKSSTSLARPPSYSSTRPNVVLNNELVATGSRLTPRSVLPDGELHQRKRRHFPQVKESAPIVRLSSLEAIEYVKTIEIQLWIDQEEHRTIQPRFTFKRHTPRSSRSATSSLRPNTAQSMLSPNGPDPKTRFWDNVTELGLVDLRMAEKEVGTFYCGKISREAVIRRLVVNENDEKDFLSHNITLPLKENGVYAVYGREPDRRDKSKHYVWKFEYTIEGKRVAHSNEKLLRPLSFICSPELLAPSQAMTVTLFHIFLKAIAPSPTAKRVPPPTMPPVPFSATGSDFSYGSDSSSASQVTGAGRIAGTIKSFGRPTTPQKDIRLWTDSNAGRRSISSGRASSRSELSMSKRSRSAEAQRRIPDPVDAYLGSIKKRGLPQGRIGSSGNTGEGEHGPSKLGLPRRLRKRGPSLRRPHTAGSSFVQAIKDEETYTRAKPPSRPATAVPSSSSLKGVKHLGRVAWDATFKTHRTLATADYQISTLDGDRIVRDEHDSSSSVISIPSTKAINQMLACMKVVVIQEQQRLETAARRNSSQEKTAIERLDSETDIKISDEASIPSLHKSSFLGRHIVPSEVLEAWITPSISLGSSRRPSTAQGSSATGTLYNSSSRSAGSIGLNRPHTSAGHGEVKKSQTYAQSLSSSETNLSLPAPPRRSPRRLPKDINMQS